MYKEIDSSMTRMQRFLYWMHDWQAQFLLSALHFSLSVLMLVGYTDKDGTGVVPVTMVAPVKISESDGMPVYSYLTNKKVGELNLWLLNYIFLLWTSVFHFLYGVQQLKFPAWKKSLSLHLRWLEYFSAALMIIIIAALTQIRDVYTLTTLAALTWAMMDYGDFEEFVYENGMKAQAGKFSPSLKGGFPFFVVWGILFHRFYTAVGDSNEEVPTFVYLIIIFLFLFYLAFWAVQAAYLLIPPKAGWYAAGDAEIYQLYARMDGSYHVLSLLSKALLSIFVYAGFKGLIE
jgi:hypothetical protein